MQITRHNYEEIFLLYVDKELCAADRKAVDVFVKEHPDLQMELWALQQTVVKADDIVLDKKDWLYMEEEVTALQENLLLYADDELIPADKKSVEMLLATNKDAQAEWNIIKQTKLQPDMAVVFADKQSLYRKEGGKVVGFKWWRAAAAAVILGFGLWAGVSVYKNNYKTTTGSTGLAGENKTKPAQIKPDIPANNTTTHAQEKSTSENTAAATTQKNNKNQGNENIKSAVQKNGNDQNTVVPKETIAVQNNNKKSDNNLPKPSLQNINRNRSNETTVAGVIPENNNSSRVSGNSDAVVKTDPKENTTNTFIAGGNNNKTDPNVIATHAVNNKTEGENNNHYLNVDDDKEKRTTLGGFIRKAKRVIERTTNVKTGEGIKIAGFEIALK